MRGRTLPALVVAMLIVAGAAWAGTAAVPSAFKLSVGSTTDADPVAALSTDDGSYLSVQSRPVRTKRKVVYVTTHDFVNTSSFNMRWVGHTGLGETCDLHIALFEWKRRRFVELSFVTVNPGSADQTVNMLTSEGARFLNGQQKLKAKMTCVDEKNFTLRTDRLAAEL